MATARETMTPAAECASVEDTVRPSRPAPPPVVHSVTAPPRRPRNRRAASRADSGSRNGWSEWMVTAEG